MLSTTVLFFVSKFLLFTIWFLVGMYLYTNIIPEHIKFHLNKLSLLELALICFVLFTCLIFISSLIEDSLLTTYLSNLDNYMSIADNNSINTITPPTSSTCGGPVRPTTTGPIGMDSSSNATSDVSTKNGFLPHYDQIIEHLEQMLNLTGNSGMDLLLLAHYFHKLQFLFLGAIFYSYVYTRLDESRVETFLSKFLPEKIVSYYIKSLKLFKKAASIYMICFFILLTISTYYSYYNLDFFIANIDKIIEVYFSKK